MMAVRLFPLKRGYRIHIARDEWGLPICDCQYDDGCWEQVAYDVPSEITCKNCLRIYNKNLRQYTDKNTV